jgi:UDP-N-acetylmuramoyl-L-alanyl-D-glutamate--2,6-diaminopimelate ligase
VRTVGVTGTNGKTSTTTFVAAALARIKRPVARITTLGFFLDDEEIDVPASHEGALQLARRARELGGEYAAVEYTSEALARGYAALWPAHVAVFTNLTHDHLDAHREPEHYLASKAQLFMHIPPGGTAILNGCDPASPLIAEVVPEGVSLITYGVASRGAPVMTIDRSAREVRVDWSGTSVDEVRTRAIGEVFAENAFAAHIAATAMGVPEEESIAAIAEAEPPAGRFEVIAREPHVVVDYAHTPDALARTLRTARSLCIGTLWVVFGAGGRRDPNKRRPMGEAASVADRVVLTTDNPRDEDPRAIAAAVRAGITSEVIEEPDRARAIAYAIAKAGRDDVIVIAGKGHERTQTIGNETRAFDDRAIARELSARRA